MPGTYYGGSTNGNNKARLVPFQFNTSQGCFLELTDGMIRIWQDDALLTSTPVAATDYDPAHAYLSNDDVLIGLWAGFTWLSGSPGAGVVTAVTINNHGSGYVTDDVVTITGGGGSGALVQVYAGAKYGNVTNVTLLAGGSGYSNTTGATTDGGSGDGLTLNITVSSVPGSLGNIFICAPYGQDNATTVPITMTVNGSDALSVTKTGSVGTQGINIALANATAANNAASAIQAAIRALVSLNSVSSNYIDLSKWTVTPDAAYYASPLIVAPSSAGPLYPTKVDKVFACLGANQFDQFPPMSPTYWAQQSSSPGGVIELATPYREADLFALDCSTQSADVLWIFHTSYPPACVERLAGNLWQYSTSLPGQSASDPPYRGTADVAKTGYSGLAQSIVDVSQASPCVVKVSALGQSVFNPGDRIYINLIAGMVELNQGEFIASAVVNNGDGTQSLTIQDPVTGNGVNSTGFIKYTGGGFAVKVIPVFNSAGNYPACGTLYQERLVVGGASNTPTQMNGSVQDDYPDFICDPNSDDYAIQFTLVSNKVDQIINMIGTPNSLILGTSGGVWIMTGSASASLSQTNVDAAKQTNIGVSSIQPQLVNDSAIFVSRSARIVMFMVFNFVSNQWENYDLTRLNRNITIGTSADTSGIVQTAFQVEPYPIFWAVRADGQLIGLVFNKQDQVFAWFRVNMTNYGGTVESVAVISRQNEEDEVAVVVNRTVNGATVRYVEFFQPQELFGDLSNAFFVNCGQQYFGGDPVTITGITQANPTVVTAPAHGFSNGDHVQITGVLGMTEINQDKTEAYTVANATNDTFELSGMDSTGFGAYTSGGTVMKVTNEVTGMSYLIGNTVVAVGDGAKILEATVVTGDAITFDYYCNLITIGIPYQVTVQPTNPILTHLQLTTRGMQQKLSRVTLSLYESMGGEYGQDLDHLYPISYGSGTMAQLPSMSTSEFTRDMDANWDDQSTFYVVQSEPFPFTLRGLMMRLSYSPD